MASTAVALPSVELLDLPMTEVRRIVENALAEDIGSGDLTTDNLVPAATMARARRRPLDGPAGPLLRRYAIRHSRHAIQHRE